MGPKASVLLGESLAYNSQLVYLDLSANAIGDEGAKLILKNLENNPNLVDLNLSLNDLTSTCNETIGEWVRNN